MGFSVLGKGGGGVDEGRGNVRGIGSQEQRAYTGPDDDEWQGWGYVLQDQCARCSGALTDCVDDIGVELGKTGMAVTGWRGDGGKRDPGPRVEGGRGDGLVPRGPGRVGGGGPGVVA